MRRFIFNNFGLKIIALLLAIAVWLIVVNVNDPIITRTISGIPVNVINANYVESLGLSSKLDDSYETVSVTISGNRSVVEKITKDEIEVTADLTQIINMDADPIMVPLTASVPGIAADELKTNPGNVQITLESMKSDDFIILATPGDSHLDVRNMEVGELTPEKETLTIVGPESLMGTIDRVVAQVDVSEVKSDTTLTAALKIFDKNGAELSEAALNNLKFVNSDATIGVYVDLWSVVNGVELEIKPEGTVAEGYRVENVTSNPETISVVGSDEALEILKENGNKITVSGEEVNIDKYDSSFSGRIDIEEYLPENIRLSENVSTTVLVNIDIEPLGSVTFEIPATDITQTNLGNGLGVVFNKESIKVNVQGAADDLSKVSASTMKPTIDFTGMTVGNYDNVKISVTLPDNCWIVSMDNASLEIFKNEINNTDATNE